MRRPLQNLHLLKADMEKKGWMIDRISESWVCQSDGEGFLLCKE